MTNDRDTRIETASAGAWRAPSLGIQSCGMEINMYAPTEDDDVLFIEAAGAAQADGLARDHAAL